MHEHQDPSQSGFDPDAEGFGDAEDFGDPEGFADPRGAAPGAERFWGQFSRSGPRREPRGGGPQPQAGNGRRSAEARVHEHGHECVEWCPICRTADVLRASSSPELREQWQSLQRDAVQTLKTLLEAYIERLDAPSRRTEARVEDIPIE